MGVGVTLIIANNILIIIATQIYMMIFKCARVYLCVNRYGIECE